MIYLLYSWLPNQKQKKSVFSIHIWKKKETEPNQNTE